MTIMGVHAIAVYCNIWKLDVVLFGLILQIFCF